jgi:hypothetical protein
VPPKITLKSLRRTISPRQREILDQVWQHIKRTHIGLPERPLLDKFGKSTLLEEVAKLGGTVISSGHAENKLRYDLGAVGIFLTSEGERLEKVVELYLIALRDAYARDKEIENFSSKDLASWLPDLTDDDLVALRHILYRTHGSLASSIGGWNPNEWFVRVDNEVVELKNVKDWREYIDAKVMQWHDARQPVGEAERSAYDESKSRARPFWDLVPQEVTVERRRAPDEKSVARARGQRLQRNHRVARTRRLDLSFVSDDLPLRNIMEDDWKEACQAYSGKAWKSCVLLCGGIVEGLLLWQLENVQRHAVSKASTSMAVDIRYDGEMLSGVIRKSKEQGLIAEDEGFLMEWGRIFRNVIHPGNQRREDRTPVKSHADLALKLVQVVAEGVRTKAARRNKQAK